jgi:hypothetical protein
MGPLRCIFQGALVLGCFLSIQLTRAKTESASYPSRADFAFPHTPPTSYTHERERIESTRTSFREKWQALSNPTEKNALLDSAGKYLTEAITQKLLPHWLGTRWQFDGYTETPRKGGIACGYLVSTLLVHAGFRLNRYKMAQQRPSLEILTLHSRDVCTRFDPLPKRQLADSIRHLFPDGLYMFGQAFHVGFLWVEKGRVRLIHSNYKGQNAHVLEEALAGSVILEDHGFIEFGDITRNRKLVEKWILGLPVNVRTES